jgi:signal transduction histidine kinase
VALILVAALGYIAGARSGRRDPHPPAPLATPAAPPAADVPIDAAPAALCQRIIDLRPFPLHLWQRDRDGRWQAMASAAASTPSDPTHPPEPAAVQQAAAHAVGVNLRLGEWIFRREDMGPQAWLLAWQPSNTSPCSDDAATQESASFSYTVSHDLRAPLRAVDGFTRILKEDYGRQLDRIGNDHLDRVLGAAARMNAMIDAMLSLARLSSQPLARQPVNLSQLAGYITDDLRRSTPTRHVQVDIEPDLQATGDPTLLRQVLENLLANAWKYTGRCEKAQIALRCKTVDGRRVFEVSDNGAGFDMRSAERLFGLFQRLHSANEFPGTGVGLASVKRIVHRHGGEIWAESTLGQGARFFFTLAG